jgi:hypothetical protein
MHGISSLSEKGADRHNYFRKQIEQLERILSSLKLGLKNIEFEPFLSLSIKT